MTDERRLATIRGLLSKAEATEFPEEAEAFFAKASELISRWALDEAMVWAGVSEDQRDRPEELSFVVHAPYMPQKAYLVAVVAAAHGCTTVRLVGGAGARTEVVSVVGFPTDLRWVETLCTSLMVQMTSAMLSQAPRGGNAASSASWRRSFIMGFTDSVRVRVEANRAAAMADSVDHAGGSGGDSSGGSGGSGGSDGSGGGAASVAVVLASRKDDVDAHTRLLHPHVRAARTSAGRSRHGRDAGRAAGRKASMDRHGIGNRRRLGR